MMQENIVIAEDGHLILTDFNLSKLIKETDNSKKNTFFGTPDYIATEVLEVGIPFPTKQGAIGKAWHRLKSFPDQLHECNLGFQLAALKLFAVNAVEFRVLKNISGCQLEQAKKRMIN